jgi:hypothetical protein
MIDFGKILKRAWHILWNYKVLWIFGILLAMTAGGGGGGNGGGSSNSGYQGSNGYQGVNPSTNPTVQELNQWFQQNIEPMAAHPEKYISTFIWIGVALLLFILIVSVLFTIVRYVSETAVIRMVDGYEQTGTKVSFKEGWKMGWSRAAFRIWLIDLITSLPFVLFIGFLIGLGFAIFASVNSANHAAAVTGVVAAIGCTVLFVIALILFGILLGLLRQFFIRKAALEDTGIGESFRQGWQMFKLNWKSAVLMYLIMFGIGIGFSIASILALIILIPAFIVMVIPGAIVAAIPGLIAYGIASLFASAPWTWIIAVIVAIPFFFTVVFAPLTLISGWYMIFDANVWTLSYREMKALESVAPAAGPEIAK